MPVHLDTKALNNKRYLIFQTIAQNVCTSMLDQLLNTGFLGLIQGLAEWLPISSTGHLKIAEHFLDLKVPILFDVFSEEEDNDDEGSDV